MQKGILYPVLALLLIALAACAAPVAQTTSPTAPPAAPDATQAGSPAATSGAAQAPIKGGNFKEVDTSDASSFQPYVTIDATSGGYQAYVFAGGLYQIDPKTLAYVPDMAESWDISSDATTYTFHLRKDIKWSDGQPLTAQDYVWTYQQASNPANKYPHIDLFTDITSYKALDDYTLQVVLKQGQCIGMATAADAVNPPLPKHIWQNLDWSDPTKNPQILNPTVVSGFFKLQEWKRDDHATFARNDSFYRGAPNFATDTIQIVPNTSVQFQMLKTGAVDSAPVTPSDYAEAQKASILKEYDWDPAVANWNFVGFNLRRPALQDVEVRHALAYATPRDAIAKTVYQGLYKPTYSTLPPTSWAYNPDVPHYDYSIDKAKQTLQAAGYKLNANGKLLNKDGTPFPRLKIYYNAGNTQREQVATILQEQFKQLGIDSDVNSLEFQAYLTYLQTAPYDYDLWVLGWQAAFEPYRMVEIWSEAGVPDLNSGNYINKQVEDLFAQANRPPCDNASRKKVFGQIQSIISNDSPYIFLTYATGYAFLNQRVVPSPPSSMGIGYSYEKWYLKTP